jgi:hypothetical protein
VSFRCDFSVFEELDVFVEVIRRSSIVVGKQIAL